MTLSGAEKRFIGAAVVINTLCLGLFLLRYLITGTPRYWFIPENILLAWLALLSAWLLTRYLKEHKWLSWQGLGLLLLWLAFLPNAWYVMTDFIHIEDTGEISQLYDIALIKILVASGFLAGFTSLYLIHKQLLKRLSHWRSAVIIGLVILAAGFAIYLGRDLRWNSWDVLANPGGLILNTYDRLIDPFGHPRMINVTSLLFVAIWQFLKPQNSTPHQPAVRRSRPHR